MREGPVDAKALGTRLLRKLIVFARFTLRYCLLKLPKCVSSFAFLFSGKATINREATGTHLPTL